MVAIDPKQDPFPNSTVEELGVSARGVVMEFGTGSIRQRVLHEINLTLKSGEMTFLVGPSGCGKTTLISILSSILTPTSGDVQIGKTKLTSMGNGQKVRFRRKHIGFIFQQYNLLPYLTAAENAAVTLVAGGVSLAKASQEAGEMLKHLDMGDHQNKFPAQLSGGQQQRVSIVRALLHKPDFMVCDEPTAALDKDSGHRVMELLKQVACDSKRVVIVVTHDNRIYPFADRIIEMSDGRIVGDRRNSPDRQQEKA